MSNKSNALADTEQPSRERASSGIARVHAPDRQELTELVHPDIRHILTWINQADVDSEHTRKSYYREAIRFLVWLQHRRGHFVRLREASGEEAVAYRQFLEQPYPIPPALCVRYGLTGSPWKKPLQGSSVAQATTILSGLYESLRRTPDEHGRPILELNPFFTRRRKRSDDVTRPRERALTVEQWHAVLETIESLEDEQHRVRCRWMFMLAYYTYLRSHELAKLLMADFRRLPSAPGRWTLWVVGKGGTRAEISVPPPLITELIAYRRYHGLSDFPTTGDESPAILSMRPRISDGVTKPMSPSAMYLIFKVLFTRAAERHPEHAESLKRASTHWMRHTGITLTLDSGLVDRRFVQKQARHASSQTTDRYDNRPIEAIVSAFSVVTAPPQKAS
ncbi:MULTISPECIES: site-specific integrase [unclassified Burkholderia]|uniref:tyrosine-type recombinase/integrase n=1 Tax=unclassified Burkholderia TaxID=2613784 RepID=UPI002AAF24DA|nr:MULTISPECIES: site-specific integrase [unclassified Burkholderia]